MKKNLYVILLLTLSLFMFSSLITSASAAFLCPVVGDGKDGTKGVIHATSVNNINGINAFTVPVGPSQFPGQNNGRTGNQAGAHANPNAYNTKGPGDPTAGPGHNPDFSPIWP